ncbi:MAG: hypothetical protein AAFX81_19415 [Pseudomonadota bacterium]
MLLALHQNAGEASFGQQCGNRGATRTTTDHQDVAVLGGSCVVRPRNVVELDHGQVVPPSMQMV